MIDCAFSAMNLLVVSALCRGHRRFSVPGSVASMGGFRDDRFWIEREFQRGTSGVRFSIQVHNDP